MKCMLLAAILLGGIVMHAVDAFGGDVHRMAATGDLDSLRKLVAGDPSLVGQPDGKWRALPIHWASYGGHVDAVRFLVECGADPRATDAAGNRPVDFAFMRGGEEVLEALVDAGADLSRADRAGLTPLIRAAWAGWSDAAAMMIDMQRSPNERTAAGDTPLHGAAWSGHRETVQRLIELGADPGATNDAGDTPGDVAFRRGEEEIAEILGGPSGDGADDTGGTRLPVRPWSGERTGRCEHPRLTILYDNYPYREGCTEDWGFSCLVECDSVTLVFDTGTRPDLLAGNIEAIGVDPAAVDMVVISHEHHDHTGGLPALVDGGCRAPVIVCRSFSYGFVRSVESRGLDVLTVSEPAILADGIYCTGELGRGIREQSLVIDTGSSLHVVVGCSHPGIVEILERVATVFDAPIDLVIGGMHLMDRSDAEIDEIADQLDAIGVRRISATHCTGEKQIERLRTRFGDRFVEAGVGRVIEP